MDVCHHISSIYKAQNILNMNFRIKEICIYTVSCITSFRCTAYILSLSFSDNEMLRRLAAWMSFNFKVTSILVHQMFSLVKAFSIFSILYIFIR